MLVVKEKTNGKTGDVRNALCQSGYKMRRRGIENDRS
jgi:hypothetical protein